MLKSTRAESRQSGFADPFRLAFKFWHKTKKILLILLVRLVGSCIKMEKPIFISYDLNYWINDLGIRTIILTCPEVYDASYKVEQSARQFGKKLAVISMGTKKELKWQIKKLKKLLCRHVGF